MSHPSFSVSPSLEAVVDPDPENEHRQTSPLLASSDIVLPMFTSTSQPVSAWTRTYSARAMHYNSDGVSPGAVPMTMSPPSFIPAYPQRAQATRKLSPSMSHLPRTHLPNVEAGLQDVGLPPRAEPELEDTLTSSPFSPPPSPFPFSSTRIKKGIIDAWSYLTSALPRQVYLLLLMHQPNRYFSRIARVLKDAELNKPDIERMIDMCWDGDGITADALLTYSQGHARRSPSPAFRLSSPSQLFASSSGSPLPPSHAHPPGQHVHDLGMREVGLPLPSLEEWVSGVADVPLSIVHFKHSWEVFIDSLLCEWESLSIVSTVLLLANIGMFVTQTSLDPFVGTPSLLSLTCAVVSLSHGYVYTMHSRTMRTMYNALRWTDEVCRTERSIWWNVEVLLAMPVVWHQWSMVTFMAAIIAFACRPDPNNHQQTMDQPSANVVLGLWVGILILFAWGLVYFKAVTKTLASHGRAGRRPRRSDPSRYPPAYPSSWPTSNLPPAA